MMWPTVSAIFLSILSFSCAFYVPGVAPVEFHSGDPVELKAVKMTSTKTQLPYEYYSVKFCRPNTTVAYKAENLGEVLRGDRIVSTPYEVKMKINSCKKLCTVKLNQADGETMIRRIKNDYAVHLLADNLPAATLFKLPDSTSQYEHGYRLGQVTKDGKSLINNHLHIKLLYHTDDEKSYRIVGFEVRAVSIANVKFDSEKTCYDSVTSKEAFLDLKGDGNDQVTFSYDVQWETSAVRWASRWDTYLGMSDVEVHWFSIINSIVVIFFLSGILTMIIIRTLRRDIAKYNRDDDVEETLEETGWKLVHGDVFRPPKYTRFLVALIGSGIQLLCMVFVTILFAMLGMLSPASRGALMSAGIFVYVFTGVFAGYFSGRLYKTLRGQLWKTAALWTGTLFPSLILGMCLFLNFFVWGKKSSGAVPFTTMLAILALWIFVLLPLVFIGFYFGYRKHPYEHPVRTNQIPRAVPELKWYHNIVVSNLISGILPFGVVFIELFFIFSAIWEKQFYYLFGFLFIVFIILIITCSQIAIVMVYFQLCGEDYHWWWRSFIVSGGSAFYVFCYAIFYFLKKLQITEFIPTLLYFGYTLLMVFAFWVLTGTIGFYAAYWFIRRIYAAIKID